MISFFDRHCFLKLPLLISAGLLCLHVQSEAQAV